MPRVVSEPPSLLRSFSETAVELGLSPGAKVVLQRVRLASLDEAANLRIAPAAPVLELRRVRSFDAVPICIDHAVMAVSRVGPLVSLDLTDRSLYTALEQLCGIRIARSSYVVQAIAVDREASELLTIDVGDPVLAGVEVAYDDQGVPVIFARLLYRGNAYRFEATLYRGTH